MIRVDREQLLKGVYVYGRDIHKNFYLETSSFFSCDFPHFIQMHETFQFHHSVFYIIFYI